jgi:hypothetical protein
MSVSVRVTNFVRLVVWIPNRKGTVKMNRSGTSLSFTIVARVACCRQVPVVIIMELKTWRHTISSYVKIDRLIITYWGIRKTHTSKTDYCKRLSFFPNTTIKTDILLQPH